MHNYQSLTAFLQYLTSQTKGHITLVLLTAFLASSTYSSMPFLFAQVVDSLMATEPTAPPPLFWPTIIVIGALIYSVCNRLEDRFVNKWSRTASRLVLKDLHTCIAQHNIHFFQHNQAGRLSQKTMQIPQALRMLAPLATSAAWSIIGVTVILLQLASFDWRVSLLLLIWTILSLITMAVYLKRVRTCSMTAADDNTHFSANLVDWLANMSLVKLFGGNNLEAKRHHHHTHKMTSAFYKMRVTTIQMSSYIQLYYYILMISTLGLIILAWREESMTPAQMVAIYPMMRIAVGYTWDKIITEFATIAEYLGQIKDGLETLTTTTQTEPQQNAHPVPSKNLKNDLTLTNIHFTYPNTQTPVLHNYTLHIPPGQKLGLIGKSGAGKSTLVHLIMGLYQPSGGHLKLGDNIIQPEHLHLLRTHVAYVPQDTTLFHRTLFENIQYGKPEATKEEVIEAAKQAHAHAFITELPQGYDTLVGERGIKLSGGQRQRIAIARAILKDAPILILDEATSALDSESEHLIQRSLKDLMNNKTVIAIAHRLSTIKHLDRLVVMEHGQIIEDGNHEDLLNHNGTYAKLWHMQSGGFIGE